MNSDSEPYQQIFFLLQATNVGDVSSDTLVGVVGFIVILLFLGLSALFSSSENAFFSLSPTHLVELNEENSPSSKVVLDLINEPDRKTGTRRLLATILLMNNLVNVFIVIFSSWLFSRVFSFKALYLGPLFLSSNAVNLLLQVVLITFLLVLLGEIIPKIYATQNNLKIVKLMAKPLKWCGIIFKPLVWILAGSSSIFDKYLKNRMHNISMEEISQAIDLADGNKEIEEKHILKGLINFGNTNVKQIMKPRTDVNCIDITTDAQELLKTIIGWNFSRIPIYEETFDQVKGILYIKDLLPHIHKKTNFNWQNLIKPAIYVPEHKKIDDLLQMFQDKRVHMAIVVDEYGGTSGIVTMEDILEEVFGEIKDEFDEEDLSYSKLDDLTFIFEGRTALHDICKILELPQDHFDKVKGDADTLGGLLMEIAEEIPAKGEEINLDDLSFVIESADNRRVKRVKLMLTYKGVDEEI
ncbi:MAG: gliding motility-associated protein GldE [Bacteroidia bacterium]